VLRNLPALRGRFYRPKTRRPEKIGGLGTIARRRYGISHVLFVPLFVPSTCSRQGRFAIRDRPNGQECAVVAEARMAVALGRLPLTRRGAQRQKWVASRPLVTLRDPSHVCSLHETAVGHNRPFTCVVGRTFRSQLRLVTGHRIVKDECPFIGLSRRWSLNASAAAICSSADNGRPLRCERSGRVVRDHEHGVDTAALEQGRR